MPLFIPPHGVSKHYNLLSFVNHERMKTEGQTFYPIQLMLVGAFRSQKRLL